MYGGMAIGGGGGGGGGGFELSETDDGAAAGVGGAFELSEDDDVVVSPDEETTEGEQSE